MFIVLWYVAVVIIFVVVALYIYVSYNRTKVAWGSGLQGIKFQVAMSVLNALQREKSYTLNWRPQILCFYHIGSKQSSYNEIDILNVV
jgi:hypothetical protein